MITDSERAGHALRIKAPKLAEAAVAGQYFRQPDLLQRYGEKGRCRCVRDVGYHINALAASVELDTPAMFVRYITWARGVMAAHGMPPSDLLMSLRSLRDAVLTVLSPPIDQAACRHIDNALEAWPH